MEVGVDPIRSTALCGGCGADNPDSWYAGGTLLFPRALGMLRAVCLLLAAGVGLCDAARPPPDMRLSNCTRTGFDIRNPEEVMECLQGAQEALYCDKKPFTEESYPGVRGGFSCHNQTFDYKPIAALHDVHMYVDGDTKVSVGVGKFGHGQKTFHPMEADHYITTILLISTDPGVGPGHRVIAMKQFDPMKDKVPEATFMGLPHTRVRAVAHCNLHGAWATEKASVVPGGGR